MLKSKDIMETSTGKSVISGSKIDGIDRISSLPADLLHIILSYLCIYDVFQMSVLSKRWKHICTTIPYFNFETNSFNSQRPNSCQTYEAAYEFKKFIYRFLICQRSIKLVRFLLSCSDFFGDMFPLIHATTRRNVEQLVLWFWLREPFELPDCLLTCESLQVLKLKLCGDKLKLPNHLGFRQLKLLHLEDTELFDEHLTTCLFSKCDVLEKLVLHDCSLDMKMLYIASASLLYITISEGKHYDNCEIKISCPSLKFIKYKSSVPKDIVIKNLFSIEDVRIFFIDCDFRGSFEKTGILVHKMIKEVPYISVLKLCKASLKGLYEEACQVRLSPISFNKLKSLKLKVGVDEDYMQVMMLLLKYSPNLEFLTLWYDEYGEWSENWMMYSQWLDRNWKNRADLGKREAFHPTPLVKRLHCTYKMHDPEESIVCLDSHLKSIQLVGFKDKENEIELLRFFLKNARVLEKLTIVWAGYAHKSEEEVLKIPRTSSQVLLRFLDPKLELSWRRNWYDK